MEARHPLQDRTLSTLTVSTTSLLSPGRAPLVSVKAAQLLTEAQTSFIGCPDGSAVKNLPASKGDAGDVVSIPRQEDALEEEMATRFSTFAWKTPWTEKPGGLQSMGL